MLAKYVVRKVRKLCVCGGYDCTVHGLLCKDHCSKKIDAVSCQTTFVLNGQAIPAYGQLSGLKSSAKVH